MGTFHAHAENVQSKLIDLMRGLITSFESPSDAAARRDFYHIKHRESVILSKEIDLMSSDG